MVERLGGWVIVWLNILDVGWLIGYMVMRVGG